MSSKSETSQIQHFIFAIKFYILKNSSGKVRVGDAFTLKVYAGSAGLRCVAFMILFSHGDTAPLKFKHTKTLV